MINQSLPPGMSSLPKENFFQRGLTKKSKTILAGETTLKKELINLGIGLGITGGAIAFVLNPMAGIGAIKKIIPTTPKGIIGTVIAVPTGIGLFKASPTARKITKEILNPIESVKRGESIGGLIENLPVPSKETLVKGATIAGIGGLVVGAGALILPKLFDGKDQEIETLPATNEMLPSGAPATITESIIPQVTTTDELGPVKKKRRARAKAKPQNINVRVNNYMESGPGNLIARR